MTKKYPGVPLYFPEVIKAGYISVIQDLVGGDHDANISKIS